MKFIVHIGTHKTGSTALQEFFSRNRARLLQHGVLYPDLELADHAHHHVAWKTRSEGAKWLADYLATVGKKAEEFGAQRVLLSSEEFEFIRDKQLLAPLLEHEVTVLAFLRRQDRYLESEYNQHVKMPDTRFSGDIYRFYFTHEFGTRFNYRHLLDTWNQATRAAQIKVVNYDRTARLGSEALFRRAVEAIELTWSDAWEHASPESENASLPTLAALYVAAANRRDLDRNAHLRLLSVCKREFAGAPRGVLLTHKDRRTMWGRFAGSNAYVSATYGLEPFEEPSSDAQAPVIDFTNVDPAVLERLVDAASSPAQAAEAPVRAGTCGHFVIGFKGSARVERFFAKNASMADFELVDAVDGRELPKTFVEQTFASSFTTHQLKHRNARWLGGTLGCLLSHMKAMEVAVERGLELAIVAEDDAVFRGNPSAWIERARSGRFDLVYLNDGMRHEAGRPMEGAQIVPLLESDRIGTGTVAYIVSNRAMRTLLATFRAHLEVGLPTGYDAMLQSLIITEGQVRPKPAWRSLIEWCKGRTEKMRTGVAMPTLVAHDDDGASIIRG